MAGGGQSPPSQKRTNERIVRRGSNSGVVVEIAEALKAGDRRRYSNSKENFKLPKNREDSSDLDENLTELIAATQTFHLKKFSAPHGLKKQVSKNVFRASRCLNIYRCGDRWISAHWGACCWGLTGRMQEDSSVAIP